MKRSTFIKNFSLLLAGTAIAPSVLAEVMSAAPKYLPVNEWKIDIKTKTISYIGDGDVTGKGVSLESLYTFLKEGWEEGNYLAKFPFPLAVNKPTIIPNSDPDIGWGRCGTVKLINV